MFFWKARLVRRTMMVLIECKTTATLGLSYSAGNHLQDMNISTSRQDADVVHWHVPAKQSPFSGIATTVLCRNDCDKRKTLLCIVLSYTLSLCKA